MNQTSVVITTLLHYNVQVRDTLEYCLRKDQYDTNLFNEKKRSVLVEVDQHTPLKNIIDNSGENGEKLEKAIRDFYAEVYGEDSTILHLAVHHSELTEVVRQDRLSGILLNATLLRQHIAMLPEGGQPDMPLFDLEQCQDVVRLQGEELEEVLNAEYRECGMEHVTIITRSNKRANMFNQAIRNRILLREEEVNAGDYLMVVKNNYYWLEEDSGMGFIANGDIVEVQSLRNHQELYGFHFADATLRFVDYPDMPLHDCKLLLETLHSESPSLTADQSRQLFDAVMEDYADMPLRADRLRAVKQNPYYNALQVKFSYALPCPKPQGGQWHTAIVDQGYLTDEMIDKEYLRWLYTAVTRATDKVYLLQFQDNFFARPDNISGD